MFSTIALLGYIFNFSILYSNYAFEAIYKIVVFNQRVDQIVVNAQKYSKEILENNSQKILPFMHEKKSGLSSQQPSIELTDVSVIWSTRDFLKTSTPILSGISFKFDNYEKVAIIGRVGCGKSTLFNAILKEAFIQNGQIKISGTELTASYAE